MKEKEITHYNRLCAELLGWEKCDTVYRTVEYYNSAKVVGNFTHPAHMKFHSDWNWLIPVVQKITKEFPEYDDTPHIESILDTLLTLNIEDIWKTVIEFIEFYNKNKKL